MSDPWGGQGTQATRNRSNQLPGQRFAEPGGVRPPVGRAAAREAAR